MAKAMGERTEMIPAPIAAARAKESREIIVRRIQDGTIRGQRIDGRWLAEADSLAAYIAGEAATR